MDCPTILLYSLLTASQSAVHKTTMHHYCGFYSTHVLPGILIDGRVVVNEKSLPFTGIMMADAQSDKIDVHVTIKKLYFVDKSQASVGDIIKNTDGQIIGKITSVFLYNERRAILVQDAFKNINIHFNDAKLSVVNKVKPIIYAGRQFSTKDELVKYLQTTVEEEDDNYYVTVAYDATTNTQVSFHRKGKQFSNTHLRVALSPAARY